jgi:hypothetical protein
MIVNSPPSPVRRASPATDVMHVWRRQIGHRHALAGERGPRPFAVIGYRIRGPLVEDRYLPLRQLTLTALFDERLETGELATRLVGVGGIVTANGLRFGGVELSRFDKDLRLAPTTGRRGARLDAADGEFCEYALSLERYLERCARHPFMPRRATPRLPVIETGVELNDACYVDVTTLPKRQVITLTSPESDLVGRSSTTVFDFVNTRFRVAR